jgi:hypothetical protein
VLFAVREQWGLYSPKQRQSKIWDCPPRTISLFGLTNRANKNPTYMVTAAPSFQIGFYWEIIAPKILLPRQCSWTGVFFLLVPCGGVRLSPLGTSATNWNIVTAPDDRWVWSIWWNENWQRNPKYSAKTCPSATLSTTNPTWRPGIEPGPLRWEAVLCHGRLKVFVELRIYTGPMYIHIASSSTVSQHILHMFCFQISEFLWSRDSSVSIATASGWTAGVRIPARERFFSFPLGPDQLWDPPSLLSKGGKVAWAWGWPLTSI